MYYVSEYGNYFSLRNVTGSYVIHHLPFVLLCYFCITTQNSGNNYKKKSANLEGVQENVLLLTTTFIYEFFYVCREK